MFNWFKKNNIKVSHKSVPEHEPEGELASIKYYITQDQNLICEIDIKIFNESSVHCFGKLLGLLERGEVMGVTIETLQILYEQEEVATTQFVDNVLTHWQMESNQTIQPIIKPTDVFKEK